MCTSVENGIYSTILFRFYSPKKSLHKNYVKSKKIQDSEITKQYMKQEGSNYGRD